MTRPTRIGCDLDFDAAGRRIGSLRLSHSDNAHAYATIPVPIAVLGGGYGPTVLLTAGNHGDEYEGQLILRRLLRELDPARLHGQLIMLPALNYPAVLAGTRCSPIDGGNMNRAYPGDPDGGPTAAIAHFVETELLPRCDFALDLHSGGSASEFLPCAFLRLAGDSEFMAAKIAACEAFGAPFTAVVGAAEDRSLSAAADRQGVVMIATELAGGASIDRTALAIGYEGTLRLLHHAGVLAAAPESDRPTRFLHTRDANDFVTAPCTGIFEPACALGDSVSPSQLAGRVYPLDDPEREPVELHFNRPGVVLCRRVPATVRRGDHVFHLGHDCDPHTLSGA